MISYFSLSFLKEIYLHETAASKQEIFKKSLFIFFDHLLAAVG